jgi:hypothetical protein
MILRIGLLRLGSILLLVGAACGDVELNKVDPHDGKFSTAIVDKNIHLKGASDTLKSSTQSFSTSSFGEVSHAAVANAQATVNEAMNAWAVYSEARFENARRKHFLPKTAEVHQNILMTMGSQAEDLELTLEVRNAAALLAEIDVRSKGAGAWSNATQKRDTGEFWMENIKRQGTVPYGGDASYKVFRNVKDYGATGNGATVCFVCSL